MQVEGKRNFNQTGNAAPKNVSAKGSPIRMGCPGVCGSCLFNVAWGAGLAPPSKAVATLPAIGQAGKGFQWAPVPGRPLRHFFSAER